MQPFDPIRVFRNAKREIYVLIADCLYCFDMAAVLSVFAAHRLFAARWRASDDYF